MQNKMYSFRDENGKLINYIVKNQVHVGNNDYIIMSPEGENTTEIYKFNFKTEGLDLVENSSELSKVKSAAHI